MLFGWRPYVVESGSMQPRIKVGDVITAVNGETVKGPKELARMIGSMDPGKTVDVSIWRDGKAVSLKLTLGTLPNNLEAKADTHDNDRESSRGSEVPKLGMTVAPAASVAGAGKEGVVVTDVDPKSAAADRGFKEGDVILEVAGKSVSSSNDVREAIKAAHADNKNSVLMRVRTGGQARFVAVPIAKG